MRRFGVVAVFASTLVAGLHAPTIVIHLTGAVMGSAVVRSGYIANKFAFFIPDGRIDIARFLPVATQTPAHVECYGHTNFIHFLDRTMTRTARDLGCLYMGLV